MQPIDMSNTTANYPYNIISYENIKKHATTAISGSILCNSYVLIPRNIVNNIYPPNLFTINELKRYLLSLIYRDQSTGCSWSGNNAFNKVFNYIDPKVFKNATNYLQDIGFIRFKKMRGKSTIFELCTLPFYDAINNIFIPSSKYAMSNSIISNLKQHFIRIPTIVFKNAFICKHADISTLYTLLKLYRYNFPQPFGGVDFNVLRQENGSLIIHDNLYLDLHMTREEFTACVNCLIEENLFYWSKSSISAQELEFEKSIQLSSNNNGSNTNEIEILIPKYQIAFCSNLYSELNEDIVL